MERELTMDQAIEIAEIDLCDGVMSAIEALNHLGFETPIYWALQKQVDINNPNYDQLNLDCRDLQYKTLGIYEILELAYMDVWNR